MWKGTNQTQKGGPTSAISCCGGKIYSKCNEPPAVSHTDHRAFVNSGGTDSIRGMETTGIGPGCIEDSAITLELHLAGHAEGGQPSWTDSGSTPRLSSRPLKSRAGHQQWFDPLFHIMACQEPSARSASVREAMQTHKEIASVLSLSTSTAVGFLARSISPERPILKGIDHWQEQEQKQKQVPAWNFINALFRSIFRRLFSTAIE
jgi:hypothetical protein